MKLSEIPKFVINLDHRTDRLEHIKNEMSYIGWDYEIFKAIHTGCHVGCALSHIGIIDLAIERNYDYVMIIEDDSTFMPYAKSLITQLELQLENVEYAILNLSPTHNRPVNISDKHNLLIDITNLPPMQEHHRGIYATNMIVYHKNIYNDVKEITIDNYHKYYAIDQYIYENITSKKQSYCPIIPIAIQKSDFSDVTNGNYNNFYLQTYNWNLYSPYKIPNEFLDYEKNKIIKENNTHLNFSI